MIKGFEITETTLHSVTRDDGTFLGAYSSRRAAEDRIMLARKADREKEQQGAKP